MLLSARCATGSSTAGAKPVARRVSRRRTWPNSPPAAPDYDEFGLFFFTQYHLDRQSSCARECVAYARAHGAW
jgi:hypothetical protein